MITNYNVKNKEIMYRFYSFIPLLEMCPDFKVNMFKNMKNIGNYGNFCEVTTFDRNIVGTCLITQMKDKKINFRRKANKLPYDIIKTDKKFDEIKKKSIKIEKNHQNRQILTKISILPKNLKFVK